MSSSRKPGSRPRHRGPKVKQAAQPGRRGSAAKKGTVPSSRQEKHEELEQLLRRPSQFRAWHVAEPAVVAGDAKPAPDPKLGLKLYGPCRTSDDPGIQQIRIGIIGTGQTIAAAQHWLERCRGIVDPRPEDEADPFLFPSFPGMEANDGFRCHLDYPQSLVETLSEADVAQCTKAPDRDHAVEKMATCIRDRLHALADRESPPQVVVVALPQEVRDVAGGGRSKAKKTVAPQIKRQLSLAFMDPKPLEPFTPSRTLHRAMKAEGMRANLPTQMVWPGSLEGAANVQDDATRAWNFCTALYYKAGGVPWRVQGLARNTCYIGISFFQPFDAIGVLQASMAQAFSDRGDGTVLRGSPFAWDKTSGPPRLSNDAARMLITSVLDEYKLHHSGDPRRVVVYKSSLFAHEELAGISEALDGRVDYFDLLSIAQSSVRFFRVGQEPPVRGTAIELCPGRYLMYTRGYVPYLKLYPGMRIPRPLEVVHARGSGSVTELMREMLALTRMNWNSADFAAAEPITMGFSRNIGLILSELPKDIEPRTSFRFYM